MAFTTTHIEFGAWLSHQGYHLLDIRIERPGKAIYTYTVDDEDLADERVAFAQSDTAKYLDQLRLLKSMSYQGAAR